MACVGTVPLLQLAINFTAVYVYGYTRTEPALLKFRILSRLSSKNSKFVYLFLYPFGSLDLRPAARSSYVHI